MVTKLKYSVTINGSSPDDLKLTPPSFGVIEAELQKVNKAQCPCYSTKARKEYLLGSRTSIKVDKVQTALKSVWANKNPGNVLSSCLMCAVRLHRGNEY
jgi:hypothetical protein